MVNGSIAVLVVLALAALVQWLAVVDTEQYQWMKGDKGAELVEFAVVVPLLFMVLYGMFWFARSFNIYETMVRAAREGAVFAARPNCALCDPGCYASGFPCTSQVVPVVERSLAAAHIDAGADLATIPAPNFKSCYAGNPTEGTCPVSGTGQLAPCEQKDHIWVCRCVDLAPNKPAGTAPICGVAVSMAYPWKFVLPFASISNQVFTIPASSQQRQEF